jgi:hypothetical protein
MEKKRRRALAGLLLGRRRLMLAARGGAVWPAGPNSARFSPAADSLSFFLSKNCFLFPVLVLGL